MKIKQFGWLVLSMLAMMGQALAASKPITVEPEIFHAATPSPVSLRLMPAKPNVAWRSAGTNSADTTLALPALSASEAQLLKNNSNTKAYRVGVGRQLPTNFAQAIDLTRWAWAAVAGGQVAHFTFSSTGASRVRVQLKIGKFPQGAELRFYSPTAPQVVFGPYTQANESFWSPTIEGDTLGLELFLPTGVEPAGVELGIPQVSHLVVNPTDISLRNSLRAGDDYSSCQVDIACASPTWQAVAKAVARYIYTEATGQTYLCSGTLMADKDIYTQVPYFLTAAHCISDAQAAANMDLFWLYANSTCGGSDAVIKQQTKGAQLLVTHPELDTTLLRLNTDPPNGVTLSGWTTNALTVKQKVTGIHHALGAPVKYAQGLFTNHVSLVNSDLGYIVTADDNGDFSEVSWDLGITAPGSSGSGLWVEQNGVQYLTGTLIGGTSSCSVPDSPDDYSRFERTLPFLTKWLGTAGTPPATGLSLFTTNQPPAALVDGVVIARYLQGTRGTALLTGVTKQTPDITALETRLAGIRSLMDVDGDGSATSDKDGLLLIRYLLGLRNTALIQGMDLTKATRTTANDIGNYLQTILTQPTQSS